LFIKKYTIKLQKKITLLFYLQVILFVNLFYLIIKLDSMKKILIILFLSCSAFSAWSQTFHSIIFANTFDSLIGEGVLQDYEKMSIETINISAALGYKHKQYFYRDHDYNIANLSKVISKLECLPNDIVFFYVSSHGARIKEDTTQFPRIAIENYLVPLKDIDEALAIKKPKFRIVMADCCNSLIGADSLPKITEPNLQISSSVVVNYKTLFAKQGSILATSSLPNEYSLGTYNGGIFTNCFLRELGNVVAGLSEATTWNQIFENISKNTKKIGNHTPVAEIKIVENNTTDNHTNNNIATIPAITSTNIEGQDIMEALLAIANANKEPAQRISMVQPLLSNFFASKEAKIEIIDKNGTTLVDRKTAENYVKFIATTQTLIQLIPLKIEKDKNGKIISLQLHEIYK
jgi:hypothetical protein